MKQYGTWVRGLATDRQIITNLLDLLENQEDDYFISKLIISRKPPDPNDVITQGNTGFTAIKAEISTDPYSA